MVVGSGMIAKAFGKYKNYIDIILFASGVSNSKETDKNQFGKELKLLQLYEKEFDKKLVYFSTCSIFDKTLVNSEYVKHKIKTEEYIKNNFKNYLIFRLPNIIGETDNQNTSFNYFVNKITKKGIIQIQKSAVRYIMDVDDLTNILPNIIENDAQTNKIMNVCFNNKMSVLEFVKKIESVLNIEVDKTIVPGGCDYKIDNNEFLAIASRNEGEDYITETIKKYLKK